MKTKIIFGIIVTLCSFTLYAQKPVKGLAGAGPDNIYIHLGLELASKEHPVNDIIGYRLERKQPAEKSWKQIADVEATTSLSDFRNKLESAMKVVPEPMPLKDIPVDKLWEQVEKYWRLDSLKFWSSVLQVRIALGITYIDASAEPGIIYEYKISKLNSQGNTVASTLTLPVIFPGIVDFDSPKLVQQIAKTNEIELKWKVIKGKRPNSFKVFRQEQLKGDFTSILPLRTFSTVKDSAFLSLRDSLIQPFNVYRYYIVPMDYYGNTNTTSDTALTASYDFKAIPLPNKITATSMDSIGGIKLEWKLPEQANVKSLKIFRSEFWDKDYQQISEVSSNNESYTDQTVQPMVKYFYYLTMTGIMGEESQPSARVFGIYQSSLQPIRPWILKSEAVKSGIRLELGSGEKEISGYRVYSGIAGQELSLVSGLVPVRDSITVFVDTNSTLSGKIEYAYSVRSESPSHKLSDFSDTVYIRPLKSSQPQTPKDLSVSVDGNIVQLYWTDMQPFEDALDGYFVYRREFAEKKSNEFKKLTEKPLQANRNRFSDSSAIEGKIYEYVVQSADLFGGKSDLSAPVRLEINISSPIPPEGVRAQSIKDGVLVKWDETFQKDISGFNLYRYERGKKHEIVANLKSNEMQFIDKKVQKGDLYFYYVTCVNSKKIESAPSREVGIRP